MVTPFAEGALLRAAAHAPQVGIEALTGGGDVVVLAPHPDDESLGCGAAIATAAGRGAHVTVVAVTDGSRSHPNSALYPAERLAALRLKELEAAVALLTGGRGEIVALGYPDQQAPSTEEEIGRAAERIAAILKTRRPAALWTTWEGDPHVDHRRTARIAERLAQEQRGVALFRYPIWGRFTETPLAPDDALYRFDPAQWRGLKERAVLSHRSQMTDFIPDDPDGFVMAEGMRRHFVESPELFIRAAGHA